MKLDQKPGLLPIEIRSSHIRILLVVVGTFLTCTPTSGQIPSQQARNELSAFLDEAVQSKRVAGGSVLVIRGGKQVFAKGYGYANVKSKRPFQISTPVVVASISKPMLGTALFRLVDRDKLNIDEPISKLLPEFSNCRLESGIAVSRAPNVTELLTHTSGLRFDRAKNGRIWFQSWTREKSLEQVVKRVAMEFPFKHEPGTKYAYSGIGTDVAARVGEVASGLSRNDLLLKELADPLGMKSTFYSSVEGVRKRKLTMPTRYYTDKKAAEYRPSRKRQRCTEGDYSSSGGSVISTAPDLAIWLSMIRDHGILANGDEYLSASAFVRMLKKQKGSYNAKGGLFIRRRDKDGEPVKYAHTGSTGTYVWIDFEFDLICISLTQTAGCAEFQKELEMQIRKCFAASVK